MTNRDVRFSPAAVAALGRLLPRRGDQLTCHLPLVPGIGSSGPGGQLSAQ